MEGTINYFKKMHGETKSPPRVKQQLKQRLSSILTAHSTTFKPVKYQDRFLKQFLEMISKKIKQSPEAVFSKSKSNHGKSAHKEVVKQVEPVDVKATGTD